jgi:hypothetical protein
LLMLKTGCRANQPTSTRRCLPVWLSIRWSK